MLRIAALTVFGLAATALAHEGAMTASMMLVGSGEVEIAKTLVARSTKFSFGIDNSADIATGNWFANMEFYKFAANSTNQYIQSVSGCSIDDSKVTLTKSEVVGGFSNTTLAFAVSESDFNNVDTTFEVTCDVTYGFRTSTTEATANLVTVPAGDHSFVDEDVEAIEAKLAALGTVTVFTATLTSQTDLAPFASALRAKMIADIKAKAAGLTPELKSTAVHVTADEPTVTGDVVCGTALAVLGTGTGYACVADLKVVFTGDLEQLTESMSNYSETVKSEMTELPADTGVATVVETKEVSGTCADGIADNGETDVDCGYDACTTACAEGKMCGKALDCESRQCVDGKCYVKPNSATTASAVVAMLVMVAALL